MTPEDPGATSPGIRTVRRGVGLHPEGGFPWKRIGLVVGTLTTCMVFFGTAKAYGWIPTMKLTFDRHVEEEQVQFAQHMTEEFAPLQEQGRCTKCLQDCQGLFCKRPDGTECGYVKCRELCKLAGDCD